MRIAVCFRGEIRTGAYAIENIKRFIGDLLPHCDFFIHTWDKNIRKPLVSQNSGITDPNWTVTPSEFTLIKDAYDPKALIIENYEQVYANISQQCREQYENNKNCTQWFVPRFYSWHCVNKLKKYWELKNNFIYDYVLVLRFDNIFASGVNLESLIKSLIPNAFAANCYEDTYTWLDDIFFLSSSDTINRACEYFIHRLYHAKQEDDKFNSGNIHFSHIPFVMFLKSLGMTIQSFHMPYMGQHLSVLREECLHYDANTQFRDCRICDLNHYQHIPNTWHEQSDEKMLDTAKRTWAARNYLPPAYHKFKNQM